MNPKNAWQKVASSKISGQWGLEKFHGTIIPKILFKVDVITTHMLEIPLLQPHEVDDQAIVGDLW
jgi:hypothetical protein